jgi:hypothetical protein
MDFRAIVAACRSVPAKLARIFMVGKSPVQDGSDRGGHGHAIGGQGRACAVGWSVSESWREIRLRARPSRPVRRYGRSSFQASEGAGAIGSGMPGSGSEDWVGSSGRASWVFGRLDGGQVVVVVVVVV